jgi:SAM-dependent methyltransferase
MDVLIKNIYNVMHNEKYKLFIPDNIDHAKILDYGCGNGNLIDWGKIRKEQYTGFEIEKSAYEYCTYTYPDFNFIYQDIYSPVYNKNGKQDFPELTEKYDVIFAYSVFTHTTYEYFLQCMNIFKSHLNEGGYILCSMILFDNHNMLRYFRHKRIQSYGSCDDITPMNVGYLYDNMYNWPLESYNEFVSIYDRSFLSLHGDMITTSMNQDILRIGL